MATREERTFISDWMDIVKTSETFSDNIAYSAIIWLSIISQSLFHRGKFVYSYLMDGGYWIRGKSS